VTEAAAIAACGEIGGVHDPDGELVVGLRVSDGSDVQGLAADE